MGKGLMKATSKLASEPWDWVHKESGAPKALPLALRPLSQGPPRDLSSLGNQDPGCKVSSQTPSSSKPRLGISGPSPYNRPDHLLSVAGLKGSLHCPLAELT